LPVDEQLPKARARSAASGFRAWVSTGRVLEQLDRLECGCHGRGTPGDGALPGRRKNVAKQTARAERHRRRSSRASSVACFLLLLRLVSSSSPPCEPCNVAARRGMLSKTRYTPSAVTTKVADVWWAREPFSHTVPCVADLGRRPQRRNTATLLIFVAPRVEVEPRPSPRHCSASQPWTISAICRRSADTSARRPRWNPTRSTTRRAIGRPGSRPFLTPGRAGDHGLGAWARPSAAPIANTSPAHSHESSHYDASGHPTLRWGPRFRSTLRSESPSPLHSTSGCRANRSFSNVRTNANPLSVLETSRPDRVVGPERDLGRHFRAPDRSPHIRECRWSVPVHR